MTDLTRLAADLDHVRIVAAITPARKESLRLAAAALRALADGDVARFVALDLTRHGSRTALRQAPAGIRSPSSLTAKR